jgi:NTE family protein
MSAAIDDAAATERRPVLVDLALQGGGSHGAFTWGVLDRLLEESWIKIEAISGTSAGAMNAAVLVDGWSRGGADGARAALDTYWRRVSRAAAFSPLQRSPLERLMGRWTLDTSPAYLAIDLMSRVFSPYDLNPMGFNPLRQILAESIDFERLAASPIKLFITATNVHTGRGRIFRNGQITPDVLLASACLPTMFQAVEIDGEAYWDGGYMGNPALFPLVDECEAGDAVLIQINPFYRPDVPRSTADIRNRLNEITFNASLFKELRSLAFLWEIIHHENLERERYRDIHVHAIHDADTMLALRVSSKLNAEWAFLTHLRDRGRKAAEDWLSKHYDDLGVRSTLDLSWVFSESLQPAHLEEGAERNYPIGAAAG